jgi:hypothetical protein
VYEPGPKNDISELRAEAFAQEAAVPREVLAHIAQKHGIAWDRPFSATDLATVMADTQVEARLIARSATDCGLLAHDLRDHLLSLQVWDSLKALSVHALSTREYLEHVGLAESESWNIKRSTTIPSRTLRLPVGYVKGVIEALEENLISIGRAAQLLMIGEEDLAERFDVRHLVDEE